MTAHHVVASLFALARAFGSASKDHDSESIDHHVSETAAVGCAKLALELEHAYRLAPPPRAPLCDRCGGCRVVRLDDGPDVPAGFVEVVTCGSCGGSGVHA